MGISNTNFLKPSRIEHKVMFSDVKKSGIKFQL